MIHKFSSLLFAEAMTVEHMAKMLLLENFNVTVRGEFKLITGTDRMGYITSALSSPVKVLRDLKGAQTLRDAGFSDPDIALALGVDRVGLRKIFSKGRKPNKKNAVETSPVSPPKSKAISLDDL